MKTLRTSPREHYLWASERNLASLLLLQYPRECLKPASPTAEVGRIVPERRPQSKCAIVIVTIHLHDDVPWHLRGEAEGFADIDGDSGTIGSTIQSVVTLQRAKGGGRCERDRRGCGSSSLLISSKFAIISEQKQLMNNACSR